MENVVVVGRTERSVTTFEYSVSGAALFEAVPVDHLQESIGIDGFDHIDPPTSLLQRRAGGAVTVLSPAQGEQMMLCRMAGRLAKGTPSVHQGIGQLLCTAVALQTQQPMGMRKGLRRMKSFAVGFKTSRQFRSSESGQIRSCLLYTSPSPRDS